MLCRSGSKIENNWALYRCNPMVMPFSSVFGHDTMKNFGYCIQTMQSNYMGYLLQPLNYNFEILNDLGGTIANGLNNARGFISK